MTVQEQLWKRKTSQVEKRLSGTHRWKSFGSIVTTAASAAVMTVLMTVAAVKSWKRTAKTGWRISMEA